MNIPATGYVGTLRREPLFSPDDDGTPLTGKPATEKTYRDWEKVNPSPPTFMGEPMPPERRARLLEMKAKRNVPANP